MSALPQENSFGTIYTVETNYKNTQEAKIKKLSF